MKKLFLTSLTLFATSISFSQLALIKEVTPPYKDYRSISYLSNSKTIIINLEEYKNNYLNLYNENMELYKKIKLPARKDSLTYKNYVYGIQGIEKVKGFYVVNDVYNERGYNDFISLSEKYFNSDDKIELIVQITEYNDNYASRITSTFLINEDGNLLHTFPTTTGNGNLKFFSINKSFIVNVYKNNSNTEGMKTEIYKVNGVVPCECNCSENTTSVNLQQIEESKSLNLSTFPNPNTGKAIIAYELPENTTKGTIHLYSQQGELLKSYSVNNQQTELEISTEEYSSGTYFYELETNGYSSGGKKMIVIN